jgi:PilZ domain
MQSSRYSATTSSKNDRIAQSFAVLRCRAEINDWAAVDDCLLRNVSLRGCYVETARPLPAGSEIDLLLFMGDRTVRAGAKVRFVHRSAGMGVEFTHLGPEALFIFQKLMSDIESGED